MKKSDLDFFMHLMNMVGWGMTSQDYDRILKFSPEGCFIAEEEGKELGIITSINYGESAWIGNLIVLPETREKGIGTLLMRRAIDHLVSTGAKAIRLDGVKPAISLYHRLGFKNEYWSLRFIGIGEMHPQANCLPMQKQDLDKVAKLDLLVFKVSRREILEYVYDLFPELCFTSWVNEDLVGYIMAKDAKDHVKIGPWVVKQGNYSVAERLLFSVMNQRAREKLWVGVPEGNRSSIHILEKNGFKSLQSSLRMCYGDCKKVENIESVFGLGGPDKG
jgi:ribosomal protein S18 acetylase RimI-like enzyme